MGLGCGSPAASAPPPPPPPSPGLASVVLAADQQPPRLRDPGTADDSSETAEPLSGKLELRIEQQGPDLPWALRITNGREEPVRIAADPRLLWFEVQPPAAKKPKLCRLPSELFPREESRLRWVRLEPGEWIVDRFDPRFYCFSDEEQPWLVPGAVVRAFFGWPEKPPKTTWKDGKRVELPMEQPPPYVAVAATPPDEDATGSTSSLAPVKLLRAEGFALRSEYSEWARARLAEDEGESLGLTIARGSDAYAESSATVQVALENHSESTRKVFFRRELLTFEVTGPTGSTSCTSGPDQRNPDRQAFLTLHPKKPMTFTSRLAELCPRGTFAKPGLYLAYVRFDATQSGAAQGINAFTGTVVSPRPALIRIRTGEEPFRRRRAFSQPRGTPGLAPPVPNMPPAPPAPAPPPPSGEAPPSPAPVSPPPDAP